MKALPWDIVALGSSLGVVALLYLMDLHRHRLASSMKGLGTKAVEDQLRAKVRELKAEIAALQNLQLPQTHNREQKKIRQGDAEAGQGGARVITHVIRSVTMLRKLLPAGSGGSGVGDAPKVLSELDDQMLGFVRRSPFMQLATADRHGLPFVSPKGDAPGFVLVEGRGQTLVIPDRPGNRILMGLQNILENPRVGLLFELPGNNLTLRVGGRAELSKDPELLERLTARGQPATVAIFVRIEYAFFHCAKAYARSKLWQPDTWLQDEYKVTFGRYFAKTTEEIKAVDEAIEEEMHQVQLSIEGRQVEPW